MKKKNIILFTTIISILLLLIVCIILNISSLVRLKASVNNSNTAFISITCDKNSLKVNESTSCVMSGYLDDKISSVSGKIISSNNLEISNIKKEDSSWQGDENTNIIEYYTLLKPAGTFNIVSFDIKAISVGSGTIKLTSYTSATEEIIQPNIGNSSYNPVYVGEPTYTIEVSNATSNDSDSRLKSLTIDNGVLSPSFDEDTYVYYVTVENNVSSINVEAVAYDSNATIEGTGNVDLESGQSKIITVKVTAKDGSSTLYKIEVYRKSLVDASKSSDNTLKELSIKDVNISPEFSSDIIKYYASVESNVNRVKITAIPNDDTAEILGDGDVDLQYGSNQIPVIVTAANGDRKIYSIEINRKVANTQNQEKCVLSSSVYSIDNTNLIIDLVNSEDTTDTIKNNISTNCGVIVVSNDKVVLSYDKLVKQYTIKRVFMPKTGQSKIRYMVVIISMFLLITGLIIYKKKNVK